ncbi:hypothetical protein Nizo1839_0430 [Lactiplantibacillus plantarum]|nr:hypothetical protein SF2A35B_1751 [Lactiplantibacillus plantarum]KZT83068.1 hypothetical protein Nizo1839_0430 [Lactiplantibacillus plantarum]
MRRNGDTYFESFGAQVGLAGKSHKMTLKNGTQISLSTVLRLIGERT